MNDKIIILRDDVDVDAIAAEVAGGADKTFDAVEVMATAAIPEADTVQRSAEGKYLVAQLSEATTNRYRDDARVLAVVDDIEVFAFDDPVGVLEEDDFDSVLFELPRDPASAPEPPSLETLLEASRQDPDLSAETVMLEEALNPEPWDDFDRETYRLEELDEEGSLAPPPDIEIARTRLRRITTWSAAMVRAPYAWSRGNYGQGVRVAVLDTGCGPNPLLRVRGGVSYVRGQQSWRDDHGHGTHVGGTIAGYPAMIRSGSARTSTFYSVAPLCDLYSVKVLDRNGRGRLSWILNGLSWCQRARIDVINLSLGSIATNDNVNDYNRAYEIVGARLRAQGAVLVAAAGNTGTDPSRRFVGNPARCPSFIAVAALDRRGRRAAFSSFGRQTELAAPGAQIMSLRVGSGFRTLSGTSMAAPHVAGAAALGRRAHRTWSSDRLRAHMDRTAVDLGWPGRDPLFGFGLVNCSRISLGW